MPLRTDPALFETIVGNLSQGIYVVQDGRAVYLNAHFGKFFGFETVEPLVGCHLFEEIYPDPETVDLFRQIHDQMLARGSQEVSWAQLSARCDGTPFWLEVEARLIEIGGAPAVMGVFKDQTECQLIAEAMVISQGAFREVLDAMEDRVYVVTDDYKIVYANRKMKDSLHGNLEADPCYVVCRGLEKECDDCSKDKVFNSDQPMYKEYFNERSKAWFSVIELAIRMPGVDRPTKLAVARDITARKESEQHIRALTHQLIRAQEDERKRLARELHDDLGQRLNAVKIGVDTIWDDLDGHPEFVRERIKALSRNLQDSIDAVRQLSAGLRPPSLERLGLVDTIRDHCRKLSALNGLKVDFSTAGMKEVKLENNAEIKLFRVVQEALHNVVKHAEASEVRVRLIASHPTVRLRIEDNGKGFDAAGFSAEHGDGVHFGLVGMRERVEIMNGRFEIASRPGEGTRVVVEVPADQS